MILWHHRVTRTNNGLLILKGLKVMDSIKAAESANSYVKYYSPTKTDIYLNTTQEVFEDQEDVFNKNKKTIIEYNGKKFIVAAPNGVTSSGVGSTRYDELYQRETLLCLAQHTGNGESVTFVTGLPSTDYARADIKKSVQKLFVGQHTFKIGRKEKTFNIGKVLVMLQPLATIMSLVLNDDGMFIEGHEKYTESRVLVIDIGFGTTDICELNNLELVRYDGLTLGMLNANRLLERKIKLQNPTIEGMPTGLELDKRLLDTDILKCGGSEYDVSELKKDAKHSVAAEIMAGVRNKGYNVREYDRVVFTGGGVLALRNELKAYVEGVNAVIVKDAQLANAKGYFRYGVYRECQN